MMEARVSARAVHQMAKTPQKPATERVTLKASYSGEGIHLPGEVIEVSTDEAVRLIGLGAAIREGEQT